MTKGLQQQKEQHNNDTTPQQEIMECVNSFGTSIDGRGIQYHSATHYHNVILFAQTKLDLVNEIVPKVCIPHCVCIELSKNLFI